RRDAGAAVSRLYRVVRRLLGVGKSRQAAPLPQARKSAAAAGEDLVRVALVPDVPHQLVAMVEVVLGKQRQGQLDDAETGAEMAAGGGDRLDDEGPDLGGQRAQAVVVHVLHVLGRAEGVEERIERVRVVAHRFTLHRARDVTSGSRGSAMERLCKTRDD